MPLIYLATTPPYSPESKLAMYGFAFPRYQLLPIPERLGLQEFQQIIIDLLWIQIRERMRGPGIYLQRPILR